MISYVGLNFTFKQCYKIKALLKSLKQTTFIQTWLNTSGLH